MKSSLRPLLPLLLLAVLPARAAEPEAPPTVITSQNLDMQSSDDESTFLFTGLVTVTGNNIKISVRDRGMGIPEADQKHLFGRFFRASNATNSTQGTGLGLYIVQRYAEMMGGTVGFESTVEEGSVFWVSIKIA